MCYNEIFIGRGFGTFASINKKYLTYYNTRSYYFINNFFFFNNRHKICMSIPALEFSTRRWLVAQRKRIVRRADEGKKNNL